MKVNDAKFALTMCDIVKTFGGTRALDGANLKVAQGTIHGLVGQNGAGKSTLIKILAGLHPPDSGKIEIAGQLHHLLTPHKVEKLGIHFIHQERLLAPTFTVGEALFLGREPCVGPFPLLNRRQMKRQAVEAMRDHFGADLPVGALIAELTPAQRQIVQITRALLRNPSLLVFDEPTAALVRQEADRLLETIQRLRGKGLTIIYISHYLNEIDLLCDSVTVLRNGVDVGVLNPKEVPTATLISMMVARNIEEMFPKKRVALGDPILTVHRLQYRNAFSEVSLTVCRGEIVGLTGLLLSFGMTIVMIGGGSNVITGGIDLSLANNLGLCAAVYASMVQSGHSDGLAIGLTLLVGLSIGLLNTIAIVGLGILPLLATLTVMNICAGFELVLTQNTVVPATSTFLTALADNGPFGISNLAYIFLALAFLLILAVGFTPWGLRLQAVGAFRQAALAAGLRVRWYIAASYLLSGLCGSVGAILSVSLLNGSSTGSAAILLSVVVSSLLGVVFSPRLVPTIGGTLMSVLFIGFLINGFQLTNVSSYWVNGVEGVLILFVVATTSLVRRSES
jgi:ribose transport system ATP-binding protein